MTFRPSILENVLIKFSVTPSLKYSVEGSRLRFFSGKIAIERIGAGWTSLAAFRWRELWRKLRITAAPVRDSEKDEGYGCNLRVIGFSAEG